MGQRPLEPVREDPRANRRRQHLDLNRHSNLNRHLTRYRADQQATTLNLENQRQNRHLRWLPHRRQSHHCSYFPRWRGLGRLGCHPKATPHLLLHRPGHR